MSFVGAVIEPIDSDLSRHFGACWAVAPGLVVTAGHVVRAAVEQGAERLHIGGPGITPVPASAVHEHPELDIAVLEVPAHTEPFKVADAGAGAPVRLGAWGPDGWLRMTSTVVSVTRIDLSPRPYRFAALLLADPADKAFSGSPVLDENGRAVAMFTQILRCRGRDRGVAMTMAPALPWLGINTDERCAE